MYYIYVLKSLIDHKLYYGQTENLEERIRQHNKGEVRSTKSRKPLKLIYFEIVNTREEALKKEKYFKSGFGRRYVNKLINNKASSSNG